MTSPHDMATHAALVLLASLLLAAVVAVGCSQCVPPTVGTLRDAGGGACDGYAIRLTTQLGAPTSQVTVEHNSRRAQLLFESQPSGRATLQAAIGIEAQGLELVDCPGGVALVGEVPGDACLAQLMEQRVCLTP